MRISLSEKLILYFLLLGLGAICIISVFSFYSTRQALLTRTFDQLTSLRIVKKHTIELFFSDRIKDITILSESKDTKKMLEEFILSSGPTNPGAKKPNELQLSASFSQYLQKYRSLRGYFKSITILGPGMTGIHGNFDDRNTTLFSDTGFFRTAFQQNNSATGIVIADEILDKKSFLPEISMMADIREVPSQRSEGKIILEISVDAINTIMLNNNPESGLGQTGETYLVGRDYLMRSTSRFQPNSILHTKVRTTSAIDAFNDREGSVITNDYRNIPVLSSYSKLQIPGINWVILAEIDLKEAMVPIFKMRNSIIMLTTLIAIIFSLFVLIISKRITRPVIELKDAAIKVGKGQYDIHLPIQTKDEIGALTASFNSMAGQIKEKTDELQKERIARLRSLFDGEEMERQRLSRELHDGIGQLLIALKLRLESLVYSDNPKIKENIQEVKEMFDLTIDEIRRISNNLMPAVLEAFGTRIAIRNLCNETNEHTGIIFDFVSDGNLEDMHTNIKIYIFRIAQEAINNIVKHSAASEVKINLSRVKDSVTLTINDNGKGFDVEKAATGKGNGLHNIRERVGLLHGRIEIRSANGKGTQITVHVPVF
ncbi:MAG: histidine kinase [Bacteroidetes bacterium]|nr:histidine kinase [Bacteroidota bacterium]